MQHTYDHINGLLLLLLVIQGIEPVPIGWLSCCYALWITPRLSITSTLTRFLRAVLKHMPALTETERGISALFALSIVSKSKISVVICGTLDLTSVSLLELGSTSSRCFTPLKIRIP